MNSDPETIESIQMRAPALSQSDFEYIQKRIKEFFLRVIDPVRRADITKRLLATEELIPSLWTLISDVRYLKPSTKILNTLLPRKLGKRRKNKQNTLRERFYFHFTKVEQSGNTIEVQQSSSSYATISRNQLDSFNLAYQQLWLCSYRVSKNFNAYGSLQLATLAHRLGFSSVEIGQKLKNDPGYAVIENVVLEALKVLRPNEAFTFDANQARPIITSLNDYLDKILGSPLKTLSPFITVAGSGEPLARRCGYGSMDAKDLNYLFLETIHAPLQTYHRGGDEVSSFYVKRSRHMAFFGVVNLTGD
ncbi:hypothetical protein BJ875DRAFT_442914 [Amylocarpus encephaloides]|uniref:Uncharacterized protein n=1 Tax=Amylocarpus encephaloides TaxID=45428 RepID=A0A9P8C427_9HELO|nr:hypothetical protein BJ875DRAFT_442914 [Amylocarpus encephaloides]